MKIPHKKTMISVCWLLCAMVLAGTASEFLSSEMEKRSWNQAKYLWIFFPYSDFMCPLCVDSLLDLCLFLDRQEKNISSGLFFVVGGSKDEPVAENTVIRKKITGFARRGGLRLPFYIDFASAFSSLVEGGGRIVLVDPSRKIISFFPIPVNEKERTDLWIRIRD